VIERAFPTLSVSTNTLSTILTGLLNANLPLGLNSSLNITEMAMVLQTETATLNNTIATLQHLVATLPPEQQPTVTTLIEQLNSTYSLVAHSSALLHVVESIQQVETGGGGLTSCPVAEAGGLWASLQDCPGQLCSGAEMFSLVNDGGRVQCDNPSTLFLQDQTRFVTSIEYTCGVTQDAPELHTYISGTSVTLQVSHRCLCPDSGSLDECSSKHREESAEKRHAELQTSWLGTKMFMALAIWWVLARFEWYWRRRNLENAGRRRRGAPCCCLPYNYIPYSTLLGTDRGFGFAIQAAAAWLMMMNFIEQTLYHSVVQDDNYFGPYSEYVVAFYVLLYALPLTLCDHTSVTTLGCSIGFVYSTALGVAKWWINPLWQLGRADASFYTGRLRILWFLFYAVPLFACALIFFVKGVLHKRAQAKARMDGRVAKAALAQPWYVDYVTAMINDDPKAAEQHVPYSLRVATCAIVATTAVVFVSIIAFFTLDYSIPFFVWQIASPSCYYEYVGEAQQGPISNERLWTILAEGDAESGWGLLVCPTAKLVATIIRYVAFGCMGFSMVLTILQLAFVMRTYRRDIVSVIRGRFAKVTSLPTATMSMYNAFMLCGFQSIALTIGLFVIFFLSFVFCVILAAVWVLPVVLPKYNVDYPTIIPTEWYIGLFWQDSSPGILVVAILAFAVPYVLLHFFLLEDPKSVALKRRRLFEAVDLYMLCFGIFAGLFKVAVRVGVALAVNALYTWRADVCLLPFGLERYDYGYKIWLGVLQTDRFYSNPHLLTFIHHLSNTHGDIDVNINKSVDDDAAEEGAAGPAADEPLLVLNGAERSCRRAVLRWQLAYTLVRNPGLSMCRRRGLTAVQTSAEGAPAPEQPIVHQRSRYEGEEGAPLLIN